jgi:adenosylhomocysteine nucleosidase
MIGIIGAMKIEIEYILSITKDITTHQKGIRTFYTGTIKNHQVVITEAGIGKVNAGVTTTLLIEYFHPTKIINIGVAGGQNGVKHKDVVIATECVYHDVDVTNFGTYLYGQVPGMAATFQTDPTLLKQTNNILNQLTIAHTNGIIASGDKFVYQKETIKEINEVYNNIYAIEMEACAIAQVAHMYQIPFIVYRSISDILDDVDQANDFNQFVKDASINASKVLEKLIESL